MLLYIFSMSQHQWVCLIISIHYIKTKPHNKKKYRYQRELITICRLLQGVPQNNQR